MFEWRELDSASQNTDKSIQFQVWMFTESLPTSVMYNHKQTLGKNNSYSVWNPHPLCETDMVSYSLSLKRL